MSEVKKKDKYYLVIYRQDHGNGHFGIAQACLSQEQFDEWLEQPIDRMTALGVGPIGYQDSYKSCSTGRDYMRRQFVEVSTVGVNFKKNFDKNRLHRLSNCTIFSIVSDQENNTSGELDQDQEDVEDFIDDVDENFWK